MKVSADVFIKKKNLFYCFMNFTFLLFVFFKKFKPYFIGIDSGLHIQHSHRYINIAKITYFIIALER